MTQVLIVDDDDDLRAVLRSALEDANYDVLDVAGGAEALALLSRLTAGIVVVVDYFMPGIDGAQLLADAASLPGPGHAFMLITASPQRISGELASRLAAQAIPVVPKPFDMTVLLDAVAQCADRLTRAP
ncbi:MAG: response regulator [Ktedonobacterales bacterium]